MRKLYRSLALFMLAFVFPSEVLAQIATTTLSYSRNYSQYDAYIRYENLGWAYTEEGEEYAFGIIEMELRTPNPLGGTTNHTYISEYISFANGVSERDEYINTVVDYFCNVGNSGRYPQYWPNGIANIRLVLEHIPSFYPFGDLRRDNIRSCAQ